MGCNKLNGTAWMLEMLKIVSQPAIFIFAVVGIFIMVIWIMVMLCYLNLIVVVVRNNAMRQYDGKGKIKGNM